MATPSKRRPENIDGDFFVDSTCIDCDTCRWMAPATFNRANGQSVVYKQPKNQNEKTKAAQALLSCPTASIGYLAKDLKLQEIKFPLLIEDNVYHCGYHSEKSYGAASYFIQRPEGNILIDSPRFSMPLVKRFEELGGISYIFLTHRDDVADHQKYHEHFNAKRIIHAKELTKHIPEAEILISHDHNNQIAEDLILIPVPGHSPGHLVLLYRNKFLFTGDHIAYSDKIQSIYAFREHCGFSWEEQINSVAKLADYNWSWLLPGHGRRTQASPEKMRTMILNCVEWMKTATIDPEY